MRAVGDGGLGGDPEVDIRLAERLEQQPRRLVHRLARDLQLEARLHPHPRQIRRRVLHQLARARQRGGDRAGDSAALQAGRIALLRRLGEDGGRVVAEISDLAGAEGLEIPAAPGLPEIHLGLVLADISDQAHRARAGFLGA